MSDIPPEIMQQLIDDYYASQGGGEEPMYTGEQATMGGAMPMYNLEGDPYTLTSQLNQLQDVNQLMADPVFQGANGGAGFSANAFTPRVSYEMVESPEYIRWQNYLNSPTSWEGMIAAELQGGGTPRSALRKLRAKVDENPEGALAQEIAMYFPVRDDVGIRPGEIDWAEAANGATEIDEMRSQIPPIGNAGNITMPDGTVIQGGGEIMEQINPDTGQPMLVRRTEEATELMEKYDELGLPYPTEQYTPEGFMGPEWQEAATALEEQRPLYGQMMEQAMKAYQDWQNFQPGDYSDQMATRDQGEAAGPGTNTVGTTDVALAGNKTGVPEYQAERGIWGTGTVPGIGTKAPVSLQEFNQIQDPAQWLDFYNRHANELSDGQRMEVIGNIMARGGPSQLGGQWDQVLNQVNNDMGVETPTGGGFEDFDLPDIGRDENPIVTQANAITDPAEYRTFIEKHLGELRPSDLADLGERATTMGMTIATGRDMDAWSNVAGSLLGGDLTAGLPEGELPTAGAQGFAGTPRLGGEVPAGSTSKIAPRDYGESVPGQTFYPQGDEEPVPPIEGGGALDQYLDNYTPRPGPDYGASATNMQQAEAERQREARPGPDYGASATNMQQAQAEARREAMLRMILPGNQQRSTSLPPLPAIPASQREAVATGQALGPPSPLQPGMNETYADYLAAQPQEAGTYRNTWGPTENPFTAFGLNQEYIPPEEPGGAPPTTINGAPNPAYQDYLDTVMAPRILQHREQRQGAINRGGLYPGQGSETAPPTEAAPQQASRPLDQMTAAMIAQIVGGGRAPMQTGERTEEEREEQARQRAPRNLAPGSILTGEERRSNAEREELAERNAPRGSVDIFGTTDRTGRRGAFRRGILAANEERVRFGQERQKIYGAAWGDALRAVYNAQLSGATPTQQVYAQRMGNIQNAGIPLNSRPQVLSY